MKSRISRLVIANGAPPNGEPWPQEQLRIIGAHGLGIDWASKVVNKQIRSDRILAFVNFHKDPSVREFYANLYKKRSFERKKAKIKASIRSEKLSSFKNKRAKKKIKKKKIMSTSAGELKIIQWLSKNGIEYKREKSLGCTNPITKQKLFFDFFLPSKNIAIEFDGVQHFKHVYDFHGNKENGKFEAQQLRDRIKTLYCENNSIRLIRIPYFSIGNVDAILGKEILNVDKISQKDI